MNSAIVAAVARHILTAIAGVFATKYAIDGATIDVIVGGFAALAGVAWSVYDKKRIA